MTTTATFTTSSSVAVELKSVLGVEYGRETYLPPVQVVPCEGSVNEDYDVDVYFAVQRMPQFWYNVNHSIFNLTPSGDMASYTPKGDNDFLLASYLYIKLPRIKVKDSHTGTYRICWCPYMGYGVANLGKIITKHNEEISVMDSYFMVFDLQFNCKNGMQKSLYERCGNKKSLVKWTGCLEADVLTPNQPWWYSRRPYSVFPLYKIDKQSMIAHEYDFNLDILSHLRMQRWNGNKWESIRPDTDVLEGLPTDNKLSIPELHGIFANITQLEKMNVHKDANEYHVESVVISDAPNNAKHGTTANISLDTNKQVCKVVYWAAENTTAYDLNCRFNFTDNSDCIKNGKSSIVTNSILYGTTTKFKELPMIHFNGPINHYFNESVPIDEGYGFYAFTCNTSRPGNDVGVVPDDMKASLICRLTSKGIDSYTLKVRSRVVRRIRIEEGQIKILDCINSI